MAKKKSKPKLDSLNILLVVTGGVAVYKAVDLASKLRAGRAQVDTILTENACRFVTPLSFEAVTARPANTSMWQKAQHKIEHIQAAEKADIVVVAPATANIIAKIANGICDDLASTLLCASWQKPILLAPAMNDKMWSNPAVKFNIESLKNMGIEIIGPETGRLACGTEGKGRMSSPDQILKRIEKIAERTKE